MVGYNSNKLSVLPVFLFITTACANDLV
ncbi:MAG: hypothetical protein ACI89Z_000453, partial [Porticoccus sp.]